MLFKNVLTFIVLTSFLLTLTNKIYAQNNTELLSNSWHLVGNNSSAEKYQSINLNVLKNVSALQVTYNLNGACILNNDASAIIFDQPVNQNWRYISLFKYGQNCFKGSQTITIPITNFQGLDVNQSVGKLHTRFWLPTKFSIDISSIKTISNQEGYIGEYWNNNDSTSAPSIPFRSADLYRQDESINFNWKSSSPDPSINKDHYIVRWTKTQNFVAGNYRFISTSDDGIRVWLDNNLLIDQWNDHAFKIDSADRNVTSGNHIIKIEYYENSGESVAKFNITQANSATQITAPVSSAPQTNVTNSTNNDWDIKSVSSMKETKDKICSPDDSEFISKWVDKAKELGANYVAVETPYDNPNCGDSLAYTKAWVNIIRSKGLKVWHRHMYLPFEGIYNTSKDNSIDYLQKISTYIKNNPDIFAPDDIFTPQPEPQNGGISGLTYCDQGVCQFSSIANFNQWLRDAIDASENAFVSIGLGGKIKIGYYGFDGFVAWGSNNPDWHGILEDATVQKMGNITVDHYPELIGQTMKQGLDELQTRYPNTPIIIGEWGSVGSTDTQQQVLNSMAAAKRPGVVGFNYWHLGMGGNESLINSDFTNRSQFDEVQSFFTGQR
jgi:hypothetical protein